VYREDLEMTLHLGDGAFGTVDLVADCRTGKRYALKRIWKSNVVDRWGRRQLLSEKMVLLVTSSPFIVRLHATFQDTRSFAFLLELLPRGDLLHVYCCYDLHGDRACAQFYSAGIVLALAHLHERGILHRDLKPENILLDEHAWPKLTDFGLARFSRGKAFTLCGTLPYMAPETLLQAGQDKASDWWSFGVMVYEMMARTLPFESPDGDDAKMVAAIRCGIPDEDAWAWPEAFTADIRGLITSLLRPRSSERLPAGSGGHENVKAHVWYLDFDWAQFESRNSRVPATRLQNPGELKLKPSLEPWDANDVGATSWDDF